MKSTKLKMLTNGAMFAAIIFAATLTGAVAPIGGGAYIHIGDAAIYVAVLLLPTPYAVAAAAIGAALADFTLGSAIYIIPTIIVKSLLVLTAKGLMKLTKNPLLQDILICLAGVVTVAGYYVAELVLLLISGSDLGAAAAGAFFDSVPFNAIQAGASAVLFLVLAGAVRGILGRRKRRAVSSDDVSSDDVSSDTVSSGAVSSDDGSESNE